MKKSIVDLLEAYPLPEQKDKPPYKIYCDMDGVLTNFESRFEHYSGMHPQDYEKKYGLPAFWELIDVKIGVKFWIGMDWMPDGKELWDFVKDHNPTILTGLPIGKWAAPQKKAWCVNKLGTNIPVITCMSKDKHLYCSPGDILIDDRESTRKSWEEAGGIFILHTSAEESINQLVVEVYL